MPQRLHPTMRRPTFQPLAIAAAAALMLGTATPVHAQLFSSGANSTSPVNLLPFAGAPTVLNFGDNILYVGNSALGSFSALAGAVLNAGALSIANGGAGGVGTVTLSGAGTKVELGANLNRLEVGNWGSGTLSVTAGALLDAAGNPGNCSNCFNVIGNGAGSTGTLTISGANSEVRTLRSFTVGQTSVFTNPPDGTTFGTPGGATTASVNVLSGGTLRTERAVVAFNNGSPSGNGEETVTGTVVVSGTGSQWIATHNSIDNQAAGITIGSGVSGTGTVTVSALGRILVDGSGGPGPNDFVNIGVNGGKGTVMVTGAGSSFDMVGVNTVLQVGRSGVTADGLGSSFSVLAGATASVLYFNVGRDGAKGTVLIDGPGSKLSQIGVGTNQSPGASGPAFTTIGRDGGTGIMTVSGGAEWLISDGGGDGRASASSPGFILGRGASSSGTLTITGAGSKVEIVSNTLNPAVGERDNYNPFVSIGYDNPGTTSGSMTISAGGKLLLTGNAQSTAAIANGTGLNIGGRFGASGTGTVTVTGTGSQILLSGYDTAIQAGRNAGSQGTLNVLAGATASSVFMIAGRDQGVGTVVIDGSGSKLTLSGEGIYSSGGVGPAQGLIGWGGSATGTVSGGGVWQITDGYDTSALPGRGPGLWVGVTAGANAATGTLNIAGAGSVVDIFSTSISPTPGAGDNFNAFAGVGVGQGSTGIVNISDGGKLLITGNAVSTPAFPRATTLNIGGNSDSVYGGTGTLNISGPGSELRVTGSDGFIAVGRNGEGTLALTNQALLEGRYIYIGRGKLSDTQFGNGTLGLASGSKATADAIFIGGNSLAAGAVGGTGAVVVSGLGSELKATGVSGYIGIGVGSGGNGTLTVTGQGKVSAIGLAVGRNNGVGQLLTQNATIELSGEQTAGTSPSGAFMVVGTGGAGPDGANRPGTGIVTLVDSTVTISNAGSLGAGVSVGGSGNFPGGTGILGLTNSQLTVDAAAGVSNISIGRNGVGLATLSASTISNANGNVFVGREVGSSGLLTLSTGSVINADYVGVGVSAKGVVNPDNSVTQFAGGAGTLILNDSTVNASMFELGAGSLLTGNNGTVDVLGDGPIVIGGTVAPGNSPGRLRFKSNVILLPGSRIELEISGSGNDLSGYEFDQLIIGEDSIFDLAGAEIVFTFLGDTDPNTVSSLGGLDLNNYFRAGSEVAAIDAPTQSLQTVFGSGQTWADVIDTSKVSAVSENPNFSSIEIVAFDPVTGMAQVVAVPEPSTWGMLFLGLAAVGAVARRRKAQAAQA